MYIAPGKGQTTPQGLQFSIYIKLLSIYLYTHTMLLFISFGTPRLIKINDLSLDEAVPIVFTFAMRMRTDPEITPDYLDCLPFWWAESADLHINTY